MQTLLTAAVLVLLAVVGGLLAMRCRQRTRAVYEQVIPESFRKDAAGRATESDRRPTIRQRQRGGSHHAGTR